MATPLQWAQIFFVGNPISWAMLTKSDSLHFDLSSCLKFAHDPCLSPWERCREATERVNCTIVTRTNFVTTNATPSVFVGNDPVSFRGSIVARTY